jgi:hypothetical protein
MRGITQFFALPVPASAAEFAAGAASVFVGLAEDWAAKTGANSSAVDAIPKALDKGPQFFLIVTASWAYLPHGCNYFLLYCP